VRTTWINKCVAIKGHEKRGLRLSDIPEREPKNLLEEKSENKYDAVVHTADEERRRKRYELERNCMVEYAILLRGGR